MNRMATVMIGGGLFAVELACVREFLQPQFPTKAPMAPEPVMGILNVRGDLVTAYDPAERLGRRPDRLEEGPFFLVAFKDQGVQAIAVDMPGDIYEWEDSALNGAPPQSRGGPSWFQGLFDTPLGVVPWLNLDVLLNTK